MPAAVAIPLIVGAASTAASVYGAKKASDAAKKAAETQAGSANTALAEQRRMYDTTRSDLQPYMQAGYGATTSLGQLLGRSRPSFGAPSVPPVSMPSGAMSLSQMRSGGGSGDMVTVAAPTGETRQVPRAAAQALVARGARIVG